MAQSPRLQRVRLGERGTDDLHPVLGGGASKRVEVEGGELGEALEEALHPPRV